MQHKCHCHVNPSYYRDSLKHGYLPKILLLNRQIFICFVDFLFSDRFRTTVNVLGDAYGAGIVAKLAENDLEMLPSNGPVESGKVPDDEWHTTSM